MKDNITLGEQFEEGLFYLRHISHPEEEKPKNECEQLIYDAMNLISKGEMAQGRKKLEEAWYCFHHWGAGERLVCGIIEDWFTEKDYEYAVCIVRTMIQEGNYIVMNFLGLLYHMGKGVKKSFRWAIYWFEKSIAHGCIAAKSNLAQILILGPKKYRDDERGIRLLKEAMKEGNAQSFNLMGICYNKGLGVERNAQKAFEMYSKAYELGAGPVCTANLANMYLKGLGVEPDIQKAKALFQEAKEGGYPIDAEIESLLS